MYNTTLNIGLKSAVTHRTSGPQKVISLLSCMAIIDDDWRVAQSSTEATLIVRLDKPLTNRQLHTLSVALEQDCIAQLHDGKGVLVGPRAEAWGEFNPEFFLKY